MSNSLDKNLLNQFEIYLDANFKDYCKKHNKDVQETNQLIRYLIEHKVIKDTTIRRYAILKEYDQLILDNVRLKKVELVRRLSKHFNLSERTIYTVLKEYKDYFVEK